MSSGHKTNRLLLPFTIVLLLLSVIAQRLTHKQLKLEIKRDFLCVYLSLPMKGK